MSAEVLAVIPARGGSTGVKRKNLQLVAGTPLVGVAVLQALASKRVNRVLVNSEDEEIRDVAARYGAETMDRPAEFHHDNSTQEVDRLLRWTVLADEAQGHSPQVVVLLYATAPLRLVRHVDETVDLVLSERFDSALTLYEDPTYLWKVEEGRATPTNYDPMLRGPRQKENWNQWAENKAVYAFTRDLIVETGCRIGQRTGFVGMSRLRSIDVDSPDDLELVRGLVQTGVAPLDLAGNTLG
jgi:N-acylneuraminate cytidylyltransferase